MYSLMFISRFCQYTETKSQREFNVQSFLFVCKGPGNIIFLPFLKMVIVLSIMKRISRRVGLLWTSCSIYAYHDNNSNGWKYSWFDWVDKACREVRVSEAWSEPSGTSKMKLFAKIGNSFKPFFQKASS